MINGNLPIRGDDELGSGAWHAPRGNRLHNGIDYACYPGTEDDTPVSGEVTKLGYPYGDDLSYRYVQITDSEGDCHRIFYIEPTVEIGDVMVHKASPSIGTAQDLTTRYPGITNHIHYEIRRGDTYINPLS